MAIELVNAGANVNQPNDKGFTPLHVAAVSTNGALCLELLVNNGADVNYQVPEGGVWDSGERPLALGLLTVSSPVDGSLGSHLPVSWVDQSLPGESGLRRCPCVVTLSSKMCPLGRGIGHAPRFPTGGVLCLHRAKKGRLLCTWLPFMAASPAPRSSSRTVRPRALLPLRELASRPPSLLPPPTLPPVGQALEPWSPAPAEGGSLAGEACSLG